MIKNLSQLKKALQIGSKYQIVENVFKTFHDGEVRTVTKVQTNSVQASREGKEQDIYLDWQKARNMRFNDDSTIDFLIGEEVKFKNAEKDYWLKIKIL